MLKTLCLLLCLAATLPATTIDFISLPDQKTASLNISGVTVTGHPGLVSVSPAGLGVDSGAFVTLDSGEVLTFTFNGASANNVSFSTFGTPPFNFVVTVHLLGGGTGGDLNVTNVSSIAGFQPITGFLIANLGPDLAVHQLQFDIVAPEPSSLAMVVAALVVLALGRLRQNFAPGNTRGSL